MNRPGARMTVKFLITAPPTGTSASLPGADRGRNQNSTRYGSRSSRRSQDTATSLPRSSGTHRSPVPGSMTGSRSCSSGIVPGIVCRGPSTVHRGSRGKRNSMSPCLPGAGHTPFLRKNTACSSPGTLRNMASGCPCFLDPGYGRDNCCRSRSSSRRAQSGLHRSPSGMSG